MPLAGAYAIASGGQSNAPPERLGDIAALAVLAAWRPTQGVYRFDPTVAEAIRDTPITGEIPTEILHRLPEWCVYIETPGTEYLGASSPGFFALLECDAKDGREELRLSIDTRDSLSTAMPIYLNRGGLAEGIEAAQVEAARQAGLYEAFAPDDAASLTAIMSIPPDMIAAEMTPRINLLLYLCCTNAEMLDRKTGRLRPTKPLPQKTKDGMRMFAAQKPVAWDIGYRLGAAIRHAQEVEPRRPGDGTHASPRPHIRRAHWHSFWTGAKAKVGQMPADRKLLLKWLPPMPVNIDAEAQPIPTLHPVR
jgi:hypothetical protein